MAYRRLSNQSLVGAVIILVGLVLLLETTGVYDADPLLRFAPSLFVLVGIYAIATSGLHNVGGPLLLTVFGSAWQLVALEYLTWAQVASLWPLLIVVFGLSVVLGHVRPPVENVDDTRADLVAIFGGRDVRTTSKAYAGGTATALFGGVDLDLRDAVVPTPPAHLTVTAAFGGVEVIVPRDWNVRVDVTPIFGGVEDERPRREPTHEETDLVVSGVCAFGGVTVTD